MTTHSEVMQHMAKATEAIKLAEAVERLLGNKDFQKVFADLYFNKYLLEVVDDLHLHESTSPEHINAIAELESVSRTKAFLTSLINKGQWAKVELDEAKDIPDSELN